MLARHAPLIATLKAGSTRVHVSARRRVLEFATGPGFFEVCRTVRSRSSTTPSRRDDIDDVRAREQLEAAQEELGGDRVRRVRRPTAGRSSSASPRREPARGRRPLVGAMRVAALPDVHGNAAALEAVLAEIGGERVDAIVLLRRPDVGAATERDARARCMRSRCRSTSCGATPTGCSGTDDERARRLAGGAARPGARRRSSTASRHTSSSTWTGSGRRASCTARRAATRSA